MMNKDTANGRVSGVRLVRMLLAGGGQVAILPHGGRVLGLYAPGSDENFLWTNPALDDAISAKALLASDQWHNTGGDRTWLAPENDFFRPDYPKMETYFQPRALDPGRYRCTRTERGVRLACDLKLHSYRTREDLRLRIVKEIAPAANPFRETPGQHGLSGLSFAGYSLRSTLEVRSQAKRTVVGLWNLLQLPHGGRMLIPVRFRANPTIYFGSPGKRDLMVGEGMLQFVMRSCGEQKIGVDALALIGRAGYLYPCGRKWALVVRNFFVNPSGDYVDGPANLRPSDAFQACSVSNNSLGSFSELEYHVPAIGGATGLTRSEDVSQVWAFRGSLVAIRRAATALLGRGVPWRR